MNHPAYLASTAAACTDSRRSPRSAFLGWLAIATASTWSAPLIAQLPQVDWIRQFGRTVPALDFATSVDAAGNVYVVGTEGSDGFVRKYDANGTELWTRFVATPFSENLNDVAVDATGVVVVGVTSGSMPGFANAGQGDAVMQRLDHDGNVLWTRQFGTTGQDTLLGVTLLGGEVYAVGSTTGVLPGQVAAGLGDAFLVKCDGSGAVSWIRQFGTAAVDNGQAVRAIGSTILVGGQTSGSLFASNSGAADAYVRAFDTSGTPGWADQFGGAGNENLLTMAADGVAFYVAGSTTGTLPGQVTSGGVDAFVACYSPTGAQQWLRQFGTTGTDIADGIAADATGVYVGGSVVGVLPGQASSGGQDAFLQKFDAAGTMSWARQFGSSGSDVVRGLVATAFGVVACGQTTGTLPGQTPSGTTDSFVLAYDAGGTPLWTRQFTFTQFAASSEEATAVAADGSIYVGGTFSNSSQARDCFVRKYDAAGAMVWSREFGTSGDDAVTGLVVDATGVYVAGFVNGTLPGQASLGGTDAWVKRFDQAGADVWTRQFGTATNDEVRAIALAGSSLYLCGITAGALDGQVPDGNDWDAFLRKMDTDGSHVWTRLTIGTGQTYVLDEADAVVTHGDDVYVGGHTYGSVDGQPFTGGPGAADGWIRKYDALGVSQWTREFGTAGETDSVRGLAVDASGIFSCGAGDQTIGSLRKFSHSGAPEWVRRDYVLGDLGFGGSALAVVGGKVYVAGRGNGVRGQPSNGSNDAVVVQYDGLGNPGWTFEIGSTGDDAATCITWSGSRLLVGGLANGALPGQVFSGTRDAFVLSLRLGEGPIDTIAPVADAGQDVAIHVGQNVSLSGLSSYDDVSVAGALFYQWTLLAKPFGSYLDTTSWPRESPVITFYADAVGEYRFQLVVSDEQGNRSAADEVIVSTLNLTPTADAGADQIVVVNGYAYLDGWSSIDPDADTIFLSWSIVDAPAGSQAVLGTMGTPILAALSPDLPGTYVLQLIVSDSWSSSTPDFVTVVAITAAEFAQLQLQQACAQIHAMAAANFDAPGHQQSLCNQMAQITNFLQMGNTTQALQHLAALLTRVDGWSLRYAVDPKGASQPFEADFVITETEQVAIYALLTAAQGVLQQ